MSFRHCVGDTLFFDILVFDKSMKWESGSEWRQVRKNKWNSSLNEFGFGDGGSWKLIFHEKYMRVIENDGKIWKDKGKIR